MTAILPDITEAAVIKVLGDFISGLVDCPVMRAQANRVSFPVGDFILMTPVHRTALATNIDTNTQTTQSAQRSTQVDVQVDCYGSSAGDRAQTLVTLLRDTYACDAMMGTGVQPLYASDVSQMPLITGEEQYLDRWRFEASLQIGPTITTPAQTFSTATVDFVSTNAQYPPN